MSESISWLAVFPIVSTLFGILASALLGIAVSKLSSVESHLEKMNGKLFSHLTDPEIHAAGVARVEEKLDAIKQTALVAHQRMDRLEAK